MIQLTVPAVLTTVKAVRTAQVANSVLQLGGDAYVVLALTGWAVKAGRSTANVAIRHADKALRATARFIRNADEASAEPVLKRHRRIRKQAEPAASATIDGEPVDLENLYVYY